MLTLLISQSKITRSERKLNKTGIIFTIILVFLQVIGNSFLEVDSTFRFSDWRLFFHLAFPRSNSFVTKLKSTFSQLLSGSLQLFIQKTKVKLIWRQDKMYTRHIQRLSQLPAACLTEQSQSHIPPLWPQKTSLEILSHDGQRAVFRAMGEGKESL